MIPGEVIPLAGEIALDEDRKSTLMVANTGDLYPGWLSLPFW